MKKLIYVLLLAVMLAGCGGTPVESVEEEALVTESEVNEQIEPEEFEEPQEEPKWWDGVISESLAVEMESALSDIGVDISIVEGITLDETRSTDLFDLRIYLLSTTQGELWMWTREWYEGEPEYEEHPTEYLTAIKHNLDGSHMGDNIWSVE